MAKTKSAPGPGVVTLDKWTPGLNTLEPAVLLSPGSAPVCNNVDLRRGTLMRRPGWTPCLLVGDEGGSPPSGAPLSAGSYPALVYGTAPPTGTQYQPAAVEFLDIVSGVLYTYSAGWALQVTLTPFTTGTGAPGGTPVVGQGYFDTAGQHLYNCSSAGLWIDDGALYNSALVPVPVPTTAVYAARTGYTSARILAVNGNDLYVDGNAVTSGNLFATPTPSLPLRCSFVSAESAVYIAAVDTALNNWPIVRYDITANTTAASVSPPGRCIAYWQNALWVGGQTVTIGGASEPGIVFWSGLQGDSGVDVWPADNFVYLDGGDADDITGFAPLTNQMLVLKNNSAWKLTGQPPDDASIGTGTLAGARIGVDTGCCAPGTVDVKNNLAIWLNQKGLFSYDGTHIRELTQAIRPFFETLDATSVRSTAQGAFLTNNQYMLIVPAATGGTAVIVVTLAPASIAQWTFTAPNVVAVAGNFTGNSESQKEMSGYLGMSDGHYASFNSDLTSDNGTPITWEYVTAALEMGPPMFRKFPRYGYFYQTANTDNYEAQLVADFGSVGTSAEVLTAGAGSESLFRALFPGPGRAFQFVLSDGGHSTAGGAPPELAGLNMEYTTRAQP